MIKYLKKYQKSKYLTRAFPHIVQFLENVQLVQIAALLPRRGEKKNYKLWSVDVDGLSMVYSYGLWL